LAILRCALVATKKGNFKPEHVLAKAMFQSTFVPSLISIKAVFPVL
jgi:hypothetical protein